MDESERTLLVKWININMRNMVMVMIVNQQREHFIKCFDSSHWELFCKKRVFWSVLLPAKSRSHKTRRNILRSAPVLNLFYATKHLNSWENEAVLISGKMTWKKKSIPCNNNLFVQNRATNIHNMDISKNRTAFWQNNPQWLLLMLFSLGLAVK